MGLIKQEKFVQNTFNSYFESPKFSVINACVWTNIAASMREAIQGAPVEAYHFLRNKNRFFYSWMYHIRPEFQ